MVYHEYEPQRAEEAINLKSALENERVKSSYRSRAKSKYRNRRKSKM